MKKRWKRDDSDKPVTKGKKTEQTWKLERIEKTKED